VLAGTLTAHAQARPDPVTGWVRHHAVPLDTVDPAATLGDLAPLRRAIGDAEIVGLGESIHGAAEEETLKHRTLRLLVEDMGFRSVAWEEDWTTGLRIDRYIRTGKGDLDALMAQLSPQWQSREVAQVLAWLRDYNTGRADKVRFVGVEYYLLRVLAYDAVEAYVARTAPQRLAELRRRLRVIRPDIADMFAYIQWYLGVADKAPYVDHARRVYRLVKGLPHRPGDRAHALALHHARQIVSFYEHYSLPQPPASESLVYRDAHAARNLHWWHRYSGGKVAYWGASAHTANAPGCGSSCRPARTGAMRLPGRTCAAGTAGGMCRSASPSTTAPSASDPKGRPPCRHRRRAGSSDRSARSASTSSPWTCPPRPRPWSGGGYRPLSGPVASPMPVPARTWPVAPWPSGST
jgi:erythromycin esterase-like protein